MAGFHIRRCGRWHCFSLRMDQVGEGEQQHDNGDVLSILVEKDFACLAPREGEDESDMFPHPGAEQGESC